jgi:PAS domain S-box-containing protein
MLLLSVAEQCALALDRARVLARERAAHRRADHARAVLDAVLANAPIGILLLDPELRFVQVNQAVSAIDGAPIDVHAGRSPPDILPSIPWHELEPMLRGVLETGKPRVDVPVEVPFPGGRVRSFLASSYRVEADDAPIGVGVIVREVTQEREAEQFQRNVLGIVGHDLRTPLTTVTASTFLLGRSALGPDEARLVARIEAASTRIRQVIEILLDYTRSSGGGGIPIKRRACGLGAVCREVADEAEGARPGRSVRCRGGGDDSGEWDPDRIRQALANLVSNALEHGAPDAPVDVSWRGGADHVAVEVSNAGAAIPPDLLPRIFDAFRSGRREQGARGGGLGLGLFIARAIAVAHGGAIDVRSREGETTFTLRLPRTVPRG